MADSTRRRNGGRRPSKWRRSLASLGSAPFSYLWQFHLKSRAAAWTLVRRVWQLGLPLRMVLAALVILTATAVIAQTAGPSQAQRATLEALFLALCALVFGASAAALAGWGASGFALIAPWLAYFSISSASMLAETRVRPLLALPIWTLLAVGWRLCVADARRWRGVSLWMALAAGAGWLTSGLTGFRTALGVSQSGGRVVLGGLLALIGLAIWWWRRGRVASPPGFGGVVVLTGGVMAGVLGVAAWYDHPATVAWTSTFFPQMDFLVTLLWFWSGGGFALAIMKLIDWTTRRSVRVGLGRVLVPGVPIVWILAGLWEWLLVGRRYPVEATELPVIALAHLAVTIAALGLVSWWRLRSRLTAWRLIEVNTVWVVSFLALLALVSKLSAFGEETWRTGASDIAVGAAIIAVLEALVRVEKSWSTAAERRVALYAAWGGMFVLILLADVLDQTWHLEQNRAIQAFEGMLSLGLPLAVHARVTRHRGVKRIPALTHLSWFVVGTLVAFGIMQLDATDPRWLVVAIPLWIVLLLGSHAGRRRWDGPTGAMAGAMLAAGTTMYWRLPAAISLPFHAAIPSIEVLTGWYDARRAVGLEMELLINFIGVPIGALCGWSVVTVMGRWLADTSIAPGGRA